jgi:hypothetical protein
MYNGEEVKDLQTIYDIIKSLTSIKLPSDEDIKHCIGSVNYTEYDNGFIQGIKWMKEQILNQNK